MIDPEDEIDIVNYINDDENEGDDIDFAVVAAGEVDGDGMADGMADNDEERKNFNIL